MICITDCNRLSDKIAEHYKKGGRSIYLKVGERQKERKQESKAERTKERDSRVIYILQPSNKTSLPSISS